MDNKEKFISNLEYKNYSENTIKSYLNDITQFESFLIKEGLGDCLESVKRERIARHFITYLSENNYDSNSVNRKIVSLNNFYNFLIKEEITDTNPFEFIVKPKVIKKLPKIISEKEIFNLYESIDTKTDLGFRNYLIFDMLYTTGIRASELINIKIKDISITRKEILITGKGNVDRYCYLTDTLVDNIQTYLISIRPNLLSKSGIIYEELFINYKGTPLTSRGLRVVLKNIIEKSGETYNLHPHVLRHAFATSLLNNGADLRSVQELLGHKNLKTTQIYTKVSNEILRRNFEKASPRNKENVKNDKR